MKPSCPLIYVKWLDANYQEGEREISEIDWKCELEYVGWLVKETEEALTLSLEKPKDGRTRNPFTILKRNVVEMHPVSMHRIPKKKQPKIVVEPTI